MTDFIEGESRNQATLFPVRLDDYISEDSSVRVIDVFVDEIDIGELGFKVLNLERWNLFNNKEFLTSKDIRLL